MNTISAIIYFIGFLLAIYPSIKLFKNEFDDIDDIILRIMILWFAMILSWVTVFMYIVSLIDKIIERNKNIEPDISEYKCKVQKKIEWENVYLRHMPPKVAYEESIKYMKLLYGEYWMYMVEDPVTEQLKIMELESCFERDRQKLIDDKFMCY